MRTTSKDEPQSGKKSSECRVDIRIESQGDVNIYTCTPPSVPVQSPTAPIAPGQCLPVTLGAKPKQSQKRKLDRLLTDSHVPSALAASFFHHSRRFLAGHASANPFEESAFALFRTMSPELQDLMSCAVTSVNALPAEQRQQMFPADLMLDPDVPLDIETFGQAFAKEIVQRVGEQVFQDPSAFEQPRPGQNRFFDPTGTEIPPIQLLICRVNGLRTGEFQPPITPGDYLPEELERRCEFHLVGDEVKVDCSPLKGSLAGKCPGNFLSDPESTCLRVPDVEAGHEVVLEGVNYISLDARVQLTRKEPATLTRDVETLVFGDLDTPLTEVVDGQERRIRDCRVHDRLIFKVPEDLPPDIYSIQIVMPNVSGIPALGNTIRSNLEFIRVVPPPTARYTISSEQLVARKETSPEFLGSDEVGLKIRSFPITGTLAQPVKGQEQPTSFRFDDVDTGDKRAMGAVLFQHDEPIIGMVMQVVGMEIDSERAFEQQIDDFWELFLDYFDDALKVVGAVVGGGIFAVGIKGVIAFGAAHPILAAIAAAVMLAVVAFASWWAPADPIILDSFGLTTTDLEVLTNANFAPPSFSSHITTSDITVNVTPLEKGLREYKEFREYVSDEEDSRYLIFYRYNRIV